MGSADTPIVQEGRGENSRFYTLLVSRQLIVPDPEDKFFQRLKTKPSRYYEEEIMDDFKVHFKRTLPCCPKSTLLSDNDGYK